jgi:hypothetical protein
MAAEHAGLPICARRLAVTWTKHDARNLAILWGIALLTRIPFLGIGESDSALFVIGARQWLRGGPQAPVIYSGHACGFYYAAVSGAIRHLHLTEQDCSVLMSAVSAVACLGILLFGYLLGLRFIGSNDALKAMLLFCLSPGLWWTTIEPHPQSVSLCFALFGIWSFVRYLESGRLWFATTSAVFLGIAMALKNDAVLLVPVLYGFTILIKPSRRNFLVALLVTALGGAISLLLARLSLGASSEAVSAGTNAVAIFFGIPGLVALVKQVAPIAFGLGLITCLVMLAAIPVEILKSSNKRPWLILLATWSLPGYLFWMFIRGNDVRHVLAFGIPLFWIVATRLRMRYVVACLLLSMVIPPNSNMAMFPSPNVPASIRSFHRKQGEVAEVVSQLVGGSSCFLGTYTNDYVLERLLGLGGQIHNVQEFSESALLPDPIVVTLPKGSVVRLFRVDASRKFVQLDACKSLEYSRDGRRTRFLGSEWHLPAF